MKIKLIIARLYYYFFRKSIKVERGENKVFVSYLLNPLLKNKIVNFSKHQNLKETVIISKVLEELNWSVEWCDYQKPYSHKGSDFDIVFGLEPNFSKACKRNPNALKIYYATGSYFGHQNQMIINRTKEFNLRHSSNYPYRRLVKEHNSAEIADIILQIGTRNTINTYPTHLRGKILLINQSSHHFEDFCIDEKIKSASCTDYIWFGSSGNILKGLDLVLDAFLVKHELQLHVVGPIENEFLKIYNEKITNATNIFFYGFMDVDSKAFRNIVLKCSFLIFPSASEGGVPGSVLNLQNLGIIPIVSKWASPEGIDQLGYQLEGLTYKSINKSLEWSRGLDLSKRTELIRKNYLYSRSNFNSKKFREGFKNYWLEFESLVEDRKNSN